jgi:hypothetical protein
MIRAALAATALLMLGALAPARAQAPSTGAAPPRSLAFTGYARDLKSNALLYVESHLVESADTAAEQRVVLYRCSPGGPAFGRKELRYAGAREEPEFAMEDARLGYLEGLRRGPRGLEVYQRESRTAQVRQRPVPANVAVVSDAGFDEFVKKHWNELEANRTVRFQFLVPSRLDYLTFKVSKHHETDIDGARASVIRLNLSGVLGWFLPYIEVSYRKSDRVLMRYKGLTNVRDAAGDNLVAQIDFPAKERVASGESLDAARRVPLVTRCP